MMRADMSGKTVFVTGAGGAIGRAISIRFAENGASVAVCDVNDKSARETVAMAQAVGGKAAFYHLDVTDAAEAAFALSKVSHDFGGVHVLVNNAGVNVPPNKRAYIDQFDDSMWDWIVRVDLDGVYKCSKAAVPHIARQGGSILNISSIVGTVPLRNQCAFAAAKAGVINLTKAMALELAEKDIRVNVIAPGSIAMESTKALIYSDPVKAEAMLSHIPLKRPGSPDDIAYAALYLSSSEAGYVTGSLLTVDGGWTCGYARDF